MVKKMIGALALMLSFALFLLCFSPISDFAIDRFGKEYTFSVRVSDIEERLYASADSKGEKEFEPRYFMSFYKDYLSADTLPIPAKQYKSPQNRENRLEVFADAYQGQVISYRISGDYMLNDSEVGKMIIRRIEQDNGFLLFSSPERWLAKTLDNRDLQICVKILGDRLIFKSFTIEGKTPEEFFSQALNTQNNT